MQSRMLFYYTCHVPRRRLPWLLLALEIQKRCGTSHPCSHHPSLPAHLHFIATIGQTGLVARGIEPLRSTAQDLCDGGCHLTAS